MIVSIDGCQFSCRAINDNLVVLEQKPGDDSDYVPYIERVVAYIKKNGCEDIIPNFISFDPKKRQIICEKMNTFDLDETCVLEIDEWYNQSCKLIDRLTEIKIHHNDLKPANFVYKINDDGTRQWYVIDFGISLIFDEEFNKTTKLPAIISSKDFFEDFGILNYFDEVFNRRDLYMRASGTFPMTEFEFKYKEEPYIIWSNREDSLHFRRMIDNTTNVSERKIWIRDNKSQLSENFLYQKFSR